MTREQRIKALLSSCKHPRRESKGRRPGPRKVRCTLTLEWIAEQYDKGCALTGLPFDPRPGTNGTGNPFVPSIDRLDHFGDYSPENCRLVLWGLNRMRGLLPDYEFLPMLGRISRAYLNKEFDHGLAERQEARRVAAEGQEATGPGSTVRGDSTGGRYRAAGGPVHGRDGGPAGSDGREPQRQHRTDRDQAEGVLGRGHGGDRDLDPSQAVGGCDYGM